MSPSSGQKRPTVGRLCIAPEQAQRGERGGGRRGQHQLLRAKHGVENRERRCRSLARVAVRAEAARRAQVARAVGRAAARRGRRPARRAHRALVLLRTEKFQVGAAPVLIISARARMNRLRVRRHAQRIVAAASSVVGRGEHAAAAGIDRLHRHLARGRLDCGGRIRDRCRASRRTGCGRT